MRNNDWKIDSGVAWRIKTLLPDNCIASFSRKCGIPKSTVRSYLSQGKMPGLKHLVSISSACGVTVDWLATGKGIKYSSDLKIAHEMLLANSGKAQ